MKRVIDYLSLGKVGLLEMLLASTLMLGGFSLAGIPLMLLMWPIMVVVLLIKGSFRIKLFRPLLVYVFFWFIHEAVIFVIDSNYIINALIGQLVYFVGFFCLYSHLDVNKLRGSFNWIALISIAGLLYQWSIILRGGVVPPLGIPGLVMPDNRLVQEIPRPSSFFMEPAAYVSFMMIPLLFAIIDRKYVWMIIIILSIFLTTSTTGILGVFIMLLAGLFIFKKINRSTIAIILIGGVLAYVLFNSVFFEYGVEKLFQTESGTNEHRLEQGIYVVSTMKPQEMILGVPYSSAAHYCLSGRAGNVAVYGSGADSVVYMSTFWLILLRFGIVGLLLYLNIYLYLFRRSKKVLPLLAFMLAVMFSSAHSTGLTYIVSLLVMCSICDERVQRTRGPLIPE